MPFLGFRSIEPFGPLEQVAASYGLAIACFVAGTHWGLHVFRQTSDSSYALIVSNVIFLVVWIGYVSAAVKVAITLQIPAFVALLLFDWNLHRSGVVSARYFRVRVLATLIVIVSLVLVVLQ